MIRALPADLTAPTMGSRACPVSWKSRRTGPEMVPVNGRYANGPSLREMFILHLIVQDAQPSSLGRSEMQGAGSEPGAAGRSSDDQFGQHWGNSKTENSQFWSTTADRSSANFPGIPTKNNSHHHCSISPDFDFHGGNFPSLTKQTTGPTDTTKRQDHRRASPQKVRTMLNHRPR